ncbi:DUF6266 family protein [Pedobacter sp. JY14-1]|uniref:DUF6266 family protein n=1 Tax=Pedobacter sp. JY14-1 TaxID=3034151 RepID=UPI0023E316F8|nr:DUF6266 family protein [Pedobacter sp. JY14-1]
MARYKNGINGPVSGKVGNVVASSWRGVTYFRAKARAVRVSSEAQELQRLKFKLVRKWLQPLFAVINVGYRFFTESKTPMNGCVGYHLKEAVREVDGHFVIDFAKAIFSRGELLISLVRAVIRLPESLLQILWDDVQENVFCLRTDRLTVVVYCPECNEFAVFEGVAQRGDGQVKLTLPAGFSRTSDEPVHVWMQYLSEMGDAVSTTQYLGKLT